MKGLSALRRTPDFTGMARVKAGQPLVNWFIKLIHLTVGRINKSYVTISVVFANKVYRLVRKQGTPGAVKYLKASYILTMQSASGHKVHSTRSLGAAVSRNLKGFPRCIPVQHRVLMRSGRVEVIRFWLSLFSIYRVLEYTGKLNISTITDPFHGDWQFIETLELRSFIPLFYLMLEQGTGAADAVRSFIAEGKRVKSGDLDAVTPAFEAQPFPIAKSGPQCHAGVVSTGAMSLQAKAILRDKGLYKAFKEWTAETGNIHLLRILEYLGLHCPFDHTPSDVSRLGLKVEPAGKVRVFAMVDCWTHWLLAPLHDAIFDVLRGIPQDGTFDQLGPIKRLMAYAREYRLSGLYSYDLSAATDRLPVVLQQVLLEYVLGPRLAKAWVLLLTDRGYRLSPDALVNAGVKGEARNYRYAVGQPMGARSSWAMLALTHHFVVQLAAYRVRKLVDWFPAYAVLGDDIVIGDKRVAEEYYRIMVEALGVSINRSKSLVAEVGISMEFAKRFIWRGQDASPISLKEVAVASHSLPAFVELARRAKMVSLARYLSVVGISNTAKSALTGLFSNLPKRCRNYVLAWFSPNGVSPLPWDLWLRLTSLRTIAVIPDENWQEMLQSVWDVEYDRMETSLFKLQRKVQTLRSPFAESQPTSGLDNRTPVFLQYEDRVPTSYATKSLTNPIYDLLDGYLVRDFERLSVLRAMKNASRAKLDFDLSLQPEDVRDGLGIADYESGISVSVDKIENILEIFQGLMEVAKVVDRVSAELTEDFRKPEEEVKSLIRNSTRLLKFRNRLTKFFPVRKDLEDCGKIVSAEPTEIIV